jgi:hypothetical protein
MYRSSCSIRCHRNESRHPMYRPFRASQLQATTGTQGVALGSFMMPLRGGYDKKSQRGDRIDGATYAAHPRRQLDI